MSKRNVPLSYWCLQIGMVFLGLFWFTGIPAVFISALFIESYDVNVGVLIYTVSVLLVGFILSFIGSDWEGTPLSVFDEEEDLNA